MAPTPTRRAAPRIDVLVESQRWKKTPDIKAVVRRAIGAAAARLSTPPAEVAIVLTDDSAIHLLNRTWRRVDAPTNVLSFPSQSATGAPRLLGDIVIAYEKIAAEAKTEHKPFAHHVAHLAVHGFLHLLGYDHERKQDATTMERLERDILQGLGVPDPYRLADKA